MQKLFDELRVSNTNTYIVDANCTEINTKQVGTGYWLLGFDRDGTCFEMCNISRHNAKDIITDFGETKLCDVEIVNYVGARYYYNENSADTGILHIH
jgi:hypothetical protein